MSFTFARLLFALFSLLIHKTFSSHDESEPNHLCYMLTHGDFDKIHFKSWTLDTHSSRLFIFEGSNHMYRLDAALLNNDLLDLRGILLEHLAADHRFRDLIEVGDSSDSIGPLHMFPYNVTYPQFTHGMFGLVSNKEVIFEIGKNSTFRKYNLGRATMEYSLTINAKNVDVPSYAVNKDTHFDNNRDDFIIYQVTLSQADNYTLSGLHSRVEGWVEEFYYLQKAERSDQLLLVHRRSQTSPKKPAFERLPILFYRDGQMYFFDVSKHCVYIVPHWDDVNLKDKFKQPGHLAFDLISLPYEHFFKCSTPYEATVAEKYQANRCGGTISPISSYLRVTLVVASLCVGGIVAIGIGLVFFFRRRRQKFSKIASKFDSNTNNETSTSSKWVWH